MNYDPDPPRCFTCVFFRREPHTMFRTVEYKTKSGKVRTRREPVRKHPKSNPVVDRCSFGNFLTKTHAICDEWRSRSGETLE